MTNDVKFQEERLQDTEKVRMESLSALTGFPVSFIKKELLVEGEELSIGELREKAMRYLESMGKLRE